MAFRYYYCPQSVKWQPFTRVKFAPGMLSNWLRIVIYEFDLLAKVFGPQIYLLATCLSSLLNNNYVTLSMRTKVISDILAKVQTLLPWGFTRSVFIVESWLVVIRPQSSCYLL